MSKDKRELRLFDSQWINIVNHDNCYKGYAFEDAVNLAVKKTEEAMAKNMRDDVWPKRRETQYDNWQTIETAPKDGTEILAWRKDCGWFIARWTCVAEFMTDNEIKKLNGYESTDEFLFSEDWFAADFISTCRFEAPVCRQILRLGGTCFLIECGC